jgi:aconitate hydratase
MYLGLRAVLAKSIERIHRANLINFAIVPIEFADPADYDRIQTEDSLEIPNLLGAIRTAGEVEIFNRTQGFAFKGRLVLSRRDRDILLAAGLLNYAKKRAMPS